MIRRGDLCRKGKNMGPLETKFQERLKRGKGIKEQVMTRKNPEGEGTTLSRLELKIE